ncbi:response regulator transcription factor [Fluviicola taffensis]|uniref:Two component transcriptional regulator, winged helix family n=1 Tax=Fluviicola taffensis (strain DSM 16823 / NCIMB 13979 / RW262) TaxID=755732 RepID=F2IDM3_FLUTR|nr:response regulator transcription factor [Fluviicola taffensis]AEA43396.1 two component transcriptional regulator, winged helix family [Fluviicola taffensis DSM 16823]
MAKQRSILLAEDDDNLGQLLQTFLKAKGYQVELARNGKHAYEKYTDGHFDFCIFDVMMPEMDGFTLAKEVRLIDPKVPILFLTAKAMKEDKLEGFESGADDYMTKPFTMEELLARIEAILRRTGPVDNEEGEMQQIGRIQYEPISRILHLKEENKKLTTKEGQLLHLLCKNRNEVLDRQAALRAIWGDDNYFNGRSMDVYIAKLRKLLKEDERIEILNIHGKGFKLIVHE